jgi:SAM-dependent methyltransferase
MTVSAAPAETWQPMPLASTGPCWICGGTEQNRVWSDSFDLSEYPRFGPHAHADHPPSWLLRCRVCGFGQPESLPATADYFNTLYHIAWPLESLDRDYNTDHKDLVFRDVLSGLERRLAPGVPKTLLDIGTHVGRFLDLARQAGWQAEGTELNPLTASYAARRTGLPVHEVPVQVLVTQGRRFGAVTLTDVLEHIPHPAPLVAALRTLLHPGGVLAIKVPHGPMQRLKERLKRGLLRQADARVMTLYVHVNHFTVGSLRRCLDGAGFGPMAITVAGPEVWSAYPTLTPDQVLSNQMRLLAFRAGRLIPYGVHTPVSLNLQVFAVNPGGSEPVSG